MLIEHASVNSAFSNMYAYGNHPVILECYILFITVLVN